MFLTAIEKTLVSLSLLGLDRNSPEANVHFRLGAVGSRVIMQ